MENQTNQFSIEQRMRTAPLSKETRDYLVVIGKFNDAIEDLHVLANKGYSSQAGDVLEPALVQFDALQAELYKLLAMNISSNMGLLKSTEI